MITTLTLNPALDINLYVDELILDDSIRVKSMQKDPGGKGLNVSRILNALGCLCSTITILGGHTGEELEDLLRKEKMFPFIIRVLGETRTNINITNISTYNQTKLTQKGSEVSQGELESLLSLVRQLGDNADIFVISGSLPPGIRPELYKDLVEELKKINPKLKIILDADDFVLKKGLESNPFLVKPNLHEAERLLKRKITSLEEQKKALFDIIGLGAETVVMSRGKDGLIASDGIKIYEVKPIDVKVKSTVGAGDALVAGICYALQDGRDFKEALEWGVLFSSAKVMTEGTSVFGWDLINSLPQRPVAIEL